MLFSHYIDMSLFVEYLADGSDKWDLKLVTNIYFI